MNKLDWYVCKSVSTSIALVLVLIVGMDFVFALIDELQDLRGEYGRWQAIIYVATTIPKRIYEYLSLSALIGALIGLGALANTSELTVMRAAGISIARIAWAVIKPILVFAAFGLALGEYVVPVTETFAQSQRAMAQSGNKALSSRDGYWHREGESFVHVNAVMPGGYLYGVTHYQFNESQELVSAGFSQRAVFEQDHWLLEGVTTTLIDGEKTQVIEKENARWDTGLTPELLSLLVVKPEDLSIVGLRSYSSYLEAQGLDAKRHLLALWKKALAPIATIVMVLVAISCVFGPMRSVTMGYRIFVGVILGLLFRYTDEFMRPASVVFDFNPLYASTLPILAFLILALILFRRTG